LTNEQWFIEFEDNINQLSIKDHNVNSRRNWSWNYGIIE
jgi:hypothetical protein